MSTVRSILVTVCTLLLVGCSPELMYADWKVDRLCKQDGGVKVFETDSPPAEFRMPDGNVDITALQAAKPSQSYYLERQSILIKSEDPVIRRIEVHLFRTRDKKLLGSSVGYVRPMQSIGVPFFHRDAHMCPPSGGLRRLVAAVFFPNSATE